MIGSIRFIFHRVQNDEPEQAGQLECSQTSESSAIAFRSIPLSLGGPEVDDLSQSPLHGKGTEKYGQVEAGADPPAQVFRKDLGKSCIGKDAGGGKKAEGGHQQHRLGGPPQGHQKLKHDEHRHRQNSDGDRADFPGLVKPFAEQPE